MSNTNMFFCIQYHVCWQVRLLGRVSAVVRSMPGPRGKLPSDCGQGCGSQQPGHERQYGSAHAGNLRKNRKYTRRNEREEYGQKNK